MPVSDTHTRAHIHLRTLLSAAFGAVPQQSDGNEGASSQKLTDVFVRMHVHDMHKTHTCAHMHANTHRQIITTGEAKLISDGKNRKLTIYKIIILTKKKPTWQLLSNKLSTF